MKSAAALALALVSVTALADTTVSLNAVDASGTGAGVGTVTISESPYGLVLTPALSGLTPGLHGFHLHQNPSCAAGQSEGKTVPAFGAGPHYDPAKSARHGTPWGDGHLGDLPPLRLVSDMGRSTPALAPESLRIAVASAAAQLESPPAIHGRPEPIGVVEKAYPHRPIARAVGPPSERRMHTLYEGDAHREGP